MIKFFVNGGCDQRKCDKYISHCHILTIHFRTVFSILCPQFNYSNHSLTTINIDAKYEIDILTTVNFIGKHLPSLTSLRIVYDAKMYVDTTNQFTLAHLITPNVTNKLRALNVMVTITGEYSIDTPIDIWLTRLNLFSSIGKKPGEFRPAFALAQGVPPHNDAQFGTQSGDLVLKTENADVNLHIVEQSGNRTW